MKNVGCDECSIELLLRPHPKYFCTQKNFWAEIYFELKKICWPSNSFELKYILDLMILSGPKNFAGKKFFRTQKFFRPPNISDLKDISDQKIFLTVALAAAIRFATNLNCKQAKSCITCFTWCADYASHSSVNMLHILHMEVMPQILHMLHLLQIIKSCFIASLDKSRITISLCFTCCSWFTCFI